MSNERVKVELVENEFFARGLCHLCGGQTKKRLVLAELTSGELKGFRVCGNCLDESRGSVDEKLAARAELLEKRASAIRGMIGRLDVPTLAEYQAAEQEALQDHTYSSADRETVVID